MLYAIYTQYVEDILAGCILEILKLEVPSSPSNFVQIPIEAPGLNQIESVSNPRVSDNPIEITDPRFLPPPSYEEVIATNDSTEEPPPTYLESFFSQVILDSQNLQCVYRSQH